MWMVPSESVIEALRDAEGGKRRLRHRVERENWMDPRGRGAPFDPSIPRPDHAVTSGHVWMPSAPRMVRPRRAGTQVIKQPKRLRLATNRKLRSKQTAALRAALMEGRIFGAGLDVMSSEPPAADFPLRGLPNCVLTPHVAAATPEARRASRNSSAISAPENTPLATISSRTAKSSRATAPIRWGVDRRSLGGEAAVSCRH
jgi:hypothetical protein